MALTVNNVEDDGAQIEIGDTYNKLLLKVSPKTLDTFMQSPLDNDSLSPVVNKRQLCCTEISSEGEGQKAHRSFIDYILNDTLMTDKYDQMKIKDYIFRAMRSENWRFGQSLNSGGLDWSSSVDNSGNQEIIPNKLANRIGASIISINSVDVKLGSNSKDDSPTASFSLENMLVVSVNGNGDDTESGRYPKGSDLQAACPVAVYSGGGNSAVYSPSDC